MDKANYVGHLTQLQSVAQELGLAMSRSGDTAPKRLFHVHGPDGAGKRTFMQRLWLDISQGEVPRILFTIDAGTSTEDMAGHILNSAVSNRSHLDAAIEGIKASIDAQAQKLEEAGRPLPSEARLTLLSDLIEQNLIEDVRNSRSLQIIFFLPDFLNLPEAIRQSIAGQIPLDSHAVSTCVIASSNRKSAEQLNSTFPEIMPAEEIPLPALTIDEVEEWAKAEKLPIDFVPELYQRCGGLPGRLKNASEEIAKDKQDKILILQAERILEGMDTEQRKFASIAACFDEISIEILKTQMSEEQAGATIQALRLCDIPGSAWQNRTLYLEHDARLALQKNLERNFPNDYRRVQPVCAQFAQIHRAIPSVEHREILARISAFNYFNEELLKNVLGTISDDCIRLLSEAPGYFEKSDTNYRLAPSMRQVIEQYMKLLNYELPDSDKSRIKTAWENRRKEILDSMNGAEEKIKQETSSLDAVQSQIKRIGSDIENEHGKLARIRRKVQRQRARPNKTKKAKNPAWQLALQAVGFVILYIGLLFSPRAASIYIVLGVGLMVGGLFIKGGMLSSASTEPQAPPPQSPSLELERHEKNLHFLKLKRGQLETKHNLIAMSIAKERSAIRNYDTQLRQPYF